MEGLTRKENLFENAVVIPRKRCVYHGEGKQSNE